MTTQTIIKWAFVFLAVLTALRVCEEAVEDHYRLVQVRQMLKDHGTPIEMDRQAKP